MPRALVVPERAEQTTATLLFGIYDLRVNPVTSVSRRRYRKHDAFIRLGSLDNGSNARKTFADGSPTIFLNDPGDLLVERV